MIYYYPGSVFSIFSQILIPLKSGKSGSGSPILILVQRYCQFFSNIKGVIFFIIKTKQRKRFIEKINAFSKLESQKKSRFSKFNLALSH